MKALLAAISLLPALMAAGALAPAPSPALLPVPSHYTEIPGAYSVPDGFDLTNDVAYTTDESLPREGYRLTVGSGGVAVAAADEAGAFYARQTLSQLLESAAEGELQACVIEDAPRFGYRGMMLDVVRCFLPIEEVFKLVDIASRLKLNTLHLHLTDDNGWRMEIDRYPRLTEVGAWRVDREEIFPARRNPEPGEAATYGGYYTKDELRALVAYAAERAMTVIPEIEMPAHAMGALASYPELACPVVDRWFGVTTGIGGRNASIIMCGGNDKCIEFVKNVLDEVMEVFPSPYIHLGGDEAAKDIWEKCPRCQARIENLGLEGCEGLQAWFMDTVNSYVRSKGRTAIGWDEVTVGRPKEDMVIMGWQGQGQVAVKYARETGSRFIMTPARSTYLIRYQGPQWFEPFTYFGNITLADAFNFEPVQADWTPEMSEQLLGIQGSMWTEFCRTPEDVQYMLYPRLPALADVAWRAKGTGDYDRFLVALDSFLDRLDREGVNYSRAMYNVQHTVRPVGDGSLRLEAECVRPDAPVSLNGEDYAAPVIVKESGTYTLSTPKGMPLDLDLNFNRATGRKVTADDCTNQLEYALTNGLRGSLKNSDFEWAGWYDSPMAFTVDLGSVTRLESISLGALGNANINVALPRSVRFYTAGKNGKFKLVKEILTDDCFPENGGVTDYAADLRGVKARYVRVEADNPGRIPEGMPREGNATWIYFDEITVK